MGNGPDPPFNFNIVSAYIIYDPYYIRKGRNFWEVKISCVSHESFNANIRGDQISCMLKQ